jgi:PDZ domain
VPQELERIIRKCLEKGAENRYQSAQELLIDVQRLKRQRELGPTVEAPVPVPASRGSPSAKATLLHGRRAPWWMYVVAASYLGFVALFFYQVYGGAPVFPGFEGRFTGRGVAVFSVYPSYPAWYAGLKEGDHVLAVNGQVISNVHDWEAIRANTEVGHPQLWQIARARQQVELNVSVPHLGWRERSLGFAPSWWLSLLKWIGLLSFILTSLVLGLIVAFCRPYDPFARMGVWVLATAAVAFGLPDGWAATWRHLPNWLSLLLWIPEISRFVPDAIFFTFFMIFPRRILNAPWLWLLIWAPTWHCCRGELKACTESSTSLVWPRTYRGGSSQRFL